MARYKREHHIREFSKGEMKELYKDIENTINMYVGGKRFLSEDEELENVSEEVIVEEIYVVGSWAEGRASNASDLDLLVLVKNKDGSEVSESIVRDIEVEFSNAGSMHPMRDKWDFGGYDIWVAKNKQEFEEEGRRLNEEGMGVGVYDIKEGEQVI